MGLRLYLHPAQVLARWLALRQHLEVEFLSGTYVLLDHCEDAWLDDLHLDSALPLEQEVPVAFFETWVCLHQLIQIPSVHSIQIINLKLLYGYIQII